MQTVELGKWAPVTRNRGLYMSFFISTCQPTPFSLLLQHRTELS